MIIHQILIICAAKMILSPSTKGSFQALAIEIHKTLNNRNPIFMKEIFSLKGHKCIKNITPATITYSFESFGFKESNYTFQI